MLSIYLLRLYVKRKNENYTKFNKIIVLATFLLVSFFTIKRNLRFFDQAVQKEYYASEKNYI